MIRSCEMSEYKPCPCGKTPQRLEITDVGQGSKWAAVDGGCCGEWSIEFRTQYYDFQSPECLALATEAWNEAPRAAPTHKGFDYGSLLNKLRRAFDTLDSAPEINPNHCDDAEALELSNRTTDVYLILRDLLRILPDTPQASHPPSAALVGLADKWRNEAGYIWGLGCNDESELERRAVLEKCADELEQILNTPSGEVVDAGILRGRMYRMVDWLEKNQPDVFSRGIWDAIDPTNPDLVRVKE